MILTSMHAILPTGQAFCLSSGFWYHCLKMSISAFRFISLKSISLNVTFDENLRNDFLSSSTHDREICDQNSPSCSNPRRLTFFFDICLIWFRFVRRTFYQQFQKSPFLVTISSHSWDFLKPNISALYLKDNQNEPSQTAPETKVSHFIFEE